MRFNFRDVLYGRGWLWKYVSYKQYIVYLYHWVLHVLYNDIRHNVWQHGEALFNIMQNSSL